MEDRTLLPSQRAEVFQLVQALSFDPAEFDWKEVADEPQSRDRKVSLLVHKGSKYSFQFGFYWSSKRSEELWYCLYVPTADRHVRSSAYCASWKEVREILKTWLTVVQREVSVPDLWSTLSTETQLIRNAASQAEENAPFTPAEQMRVRQAIHELREHLVGTSQLTKEQLEFIDGRLRHLEAASSRLGRKDWISLAVGVLTTIAVGVALAPDSARELFFIAGKLFSWLVHNVPSLP